MGFEAGEGVGTWIRNMSETETSKKQAVDIVVYGATPGGIAAACRAAGSGARVVLVEASPFIGGHLTSGICTTECEHMLPITFGGWMMTFLRRIGKHYGIDAPLHRWEPKAALASYTELLAEAGVEVLTADPLDDVLVEGGRIREIRLVGGRVLSGSFFIDASYEGDLMAGAGVPYAVGREPIRAHGESYAGVRFIDSLEEVQNSKGHALNFDRIWEIDLLDPEEGTIEGVTPADPARLERGEGDGKVMNYHYRVTVTSAADRIPFIRPPGYREERFALLARFLHSHPETPLNQILGFLKHPSGRYAPGPDGFTVVTPGEKWELNNVQASVLSLGHLGGQFAYPDGSREERKVVLEDHYNHNAGLLYFLANSSDVPAALREEAGRLGLPPDEFTDNGNWPYQPYIRETRRMKGAYVLTQHDVLENRQKPDTVLWNSHWIDSHHVERLALDGSHFRNEGRIWHEVTEPYAIPYRSLVPEATAVTNLIVPGCVSSTHVAFCSVRLESTWMGLGEAAAEAAVQVLESGRAVQEVDIRRLQKTLRGNGVNLPERI